MIAEQKRDDVNTNRGRQRLHKVVRGELVKATSASSPRFTDDPTNRYRLLPPMVSCPLSEVAQVHPGISTKHQRDCQESTEQTHSHDAQCLVEM